MVAIRRTVVSEKIKQAGQQVDGKQAAGPRGVAQWPGKPFLNVLWASPVATGQLVVFRRRLRLQPAISVEVRPRGLDRAAQLPNDRVECCRSVGE